MMPISPSCHWYEGVFFCYNGENKHSMSLEELNDKLHARDAHLDRARQPDAFRPDENRTNPETVSQFQRTESWGDDSLPPKHELKLPEPVQAVVFPDERGKHRRKMLAIALGGMAVVLLIGGLLVKLRSGIFSEESVVIALLGNAETRSAELATFDFEYRNDNWMSIDNAVIIFEYPESFHPEPLAKLDIKKSRAEYVLGEVPAQTRGKVTLSGKFYGSKGDQAKVQATLRYSPSALSTLYEKRTERTVTLVSSPLFFEMSAPLELASDQEAQYEIRYGNNGDTSFSNLKVKLEYPVEFVFTEAEPQPSEGKNIWEVGVLPPRGEGKIVVRGRLTGLRDEQKLVQGGIGIVQGDGTFLSYGDHSRKTKIVASPFSIRQVVNGQSALSIGPGEPLHYEIEYRNDGNIGIRDAIVSISLDSPYLDFSTLQFVGNSRGAYDQSRKIIFWKASDVPALSRVEAGQSGKIAFNIKSFSGLEKRFPGVRNPIIQSVAKIESTDIPAIVGITKVVASATLPIKLNTIVTPVLKGYYQDATIPNTGPMPPMVGQETTYTFHFTLANSSNDVKDAQASIFLPTGVRYTGKRLPESESFIYNERSNELIWRPGLLGAGTERKITFQLSVTPDPSSVNQEVILISRMVVTGKDTFTERDIRLEQAGKSSSLPEDTSMTSTDFWVH